MEQKRTILTWLAGMWPSGIYHVLIITMKHIESFGPIKFYGNLIALTLSDKNSWRKVSNILNYTRVIMTPRLTVDPTAQRVSAYEYTSQAIKDCKMPENVKDALKVGMKREFGFEL